MNVAGYPIGIDSHLQDINNLVGVKIEGLKSTLEDPVTEELIQQPRLGIEETRIWMHDMIEEMGEEPHSYRMVSVCVNVCVFSARYIC